LFGELRGLVARIAAELPQVMATATLGRLFMAWLASEWPQGQGHVQ
jgi:hypothetical protein